MGLRELETAGVADALERAADVIAERGLAKGLRIDPVTNSLDPVAALAFGAGAPIDMIRNSCCLEDLGVPAVREVAVILAVECLEAMLGQSLEEWSDAKDVKTKDVQKLFLKMATRIRIAIT